MLYFAFGSNMLTSRLVRRCPSAQVVARAVAPGYRVAFEKLSEDTSGKATLVAGDGPDFAAGVVYELSASDVDALDAFEGPGYRRMEGLSVTCLETGNTLEVCTYVAKREVAGLKPFDWYLALVIAGLTQNGIDTEFARQLKTKACETDVNHVRQTRRNALRDLDAAGFSDYLALLGANT